MAQGIAQAEPPATSGVSFQSGTAPTTQADPEIESMDTVVNLTADQKKRIAEIQAPLREALSKWDKVYGERLEAALKARKAAHAAGDDKAVTKMAKEIADLLTSRWEIFKEYDATTVFTPEQKTKWNVHVLLFGQLWKRRAANVTADQEKKLKALASDLARKGGLDGDKAMSAASEAMNAKLDEMLTNEQKEAVRKAVESHWVPASQPSTASRPMPPVAPPIPPPDKAVGGTPER
jgi:hypothetical protein